MKDIKQRISNLTNCYQKQLASYQRIIDFGKQEKKLIDEGNIENLLPLLEEKKQIMENINSDGEKINENQDFLVSFFEMPEFSVSFLLQKADVKYKEEILELQTVINQLVENLEILEAQEKEHEQQLKCFSEKYKQEITKQKLNEQVKKQANKAYNDQQKSYNEDKK